MLNFVFQKMVTKLKEVQEDVDKAEEDLEEDLVMTLTVMEPKVLFFILILIFPKTSKKIFLGAGEGSQGIGGGLDGDVDGGGEGGQGIGGALGGGDSMGYQVSKEEE